MQEYSFFDNVLEVVKLIPRGRVTSYGAIARYLGSASASRSVGWALNQSISRQDPIPAHRVVNRNGMLTGKFHFHGKSMQERLEEEGIQIKDDRVVRFSELFWEPSGEL
jgi:methylated-DNA-protein-cysteine methyltransferase-like protein